MGDFGSWYLLCILKHCKSKILFNVYAGRHNRSFKLLVLQSQKEQIIFLLKYVSLSWYI